MFAKQMKMIKLPLLFVLFYLIAVYALCILRIVGLLYQNEIIIGVYDWANCVFENYDGIDGSWLQNCGEHPLYRLSFVLYAFVSLAMGAQPVPFFLIFGINPENKLLWYGYFEPYIAKLPPCCRKCFERKEKENKKELSRQSSSFSLEMVTSRLTLKRSTSSGSSSPKSQDALSGSNPMFKGQNP